MRKLAAGKVYSRIFDAPDENTTISKEPSTRTLRIYLIKTKTSEPSFKQ